MHTLEHITAYQGLSLRRRRRPCHWHSGSAWKCLGIKINCQFIPLLVLFHLFSVKRIAVNFEFFTSGVVELLGSNRDVT